MFSVQKHTMTTKLSELKQLDSFWKNMQLIKKNQWYVDVYHWEMLFPQHQDRPGLALTAAGVCGPGEVWDTNLSKYYH